MLVRTASDRVEIQAPAKINLFLEVLAKRPDGYHEIETLMARVGLFDSLSFTSTENSDIRLDCRWSLGSSRDMGELPPAEKNIVTRAASLLQQRSGCKQGAAIQLVKRIPSTAGLGGASSDAAATLVAANLAWKLGWSRERLMALAAEIGSDVPFFLAGGSAVCRGRGERIEAAEPVFVHVVVVRPPVGLSTPEVYSRCVPARAPKTVGPLLESLAKGEWRMVRESLVNRLEEPASQLTPWIGRLRQEFEQAGCAIHQMSGSGSSYFGICRSRNHARRVAGRLRSRNVGLVMMLTTLG